MSGKSIDRYLVDPNNTRIRHLDGIPWDQAPLPRRWHLCKSQTQGWENLLAFIRRCACGAVSYDRTGWTGRNSRRD